MNNTVPVLNDYEDTVSCWLSQTVHDGCQLEANPRFQSVGQSAPSARISGDETVSPLWCIGTIGGTD